MIWFTLVLAALATIASAAGLLAPAVYEKEPLSWAVQGRGQDVVTLAMAVPLLVGTGAAMARGSLRARLVWAGVVLYLLYSYVLYAFFVHFGPVFPVYVATLGLSFYALAVAVVRTDIGALTAAAASVRTTRISIALAAVGAMFALLWATEVASALATGGVPPAVADLGFKVNPIHVLDLAFFCPGALLTAALLRRRHPLGFLLAVPLLVFCALMGLAILSMMIAMRNAGLPWSVGPAAMMTVIVVATAWLARGALRELRGAH